MKNFKQFLLWCLGLVAAAFLAVCISSCSSDEIDDMEEEIIVDCPEVDPPDWLIATWATNSGSTITFKYGDITGQNSSFCEPSINSPVPIEFIQIESTDDVYRYTVTVDTFQQEIVNYVRIGDFQVGRCYGDLPCDFYSILTKQ